MKKKARTRGKKHRSVEPRVSPFVIEAVCGEHASDEWLAGLRSVAETSLSLIQMRTTDEDKYLNVLTVVRNLYVLCKVFEEAPQFQLLSVIAYSAVFFLRDRRASEDLPQEVVTAACRPVQAAVEAYFAMAGEVRRSTLIASLRYAESRDVRVVPRSGTHFWMIDGEGTDDSDLDRVLRVRGAAFWDGEVITGYVDRIGGRLIYVDVLRKAKLVVTKPTFFVITDENDKVNPEALGL